MFRAGDAFDVNEAVEGGALELGIFFVNDAPGGGVLAVPNASLFFIGSADVVEHAAKFDFGLLLGSELAAGLGFLEGGEFLGEHFSELDRRGGAASFDIDGVGGEAALLVPGGNIGGGGEEHALEVEAGEHFAGDEGEADFVAVTDKPHLGGDAGAEVEHGFVAAGDGDAGGFLEESTFKWFVAAFPFSEFEATGEFGIAQVDRVTEEAGEKGGAAGAFDELGGTSEEAEDDAGEGGGGHGAAGDLDEEFGTAGDGSALLAEFVFGGGELIEAAGMSEILEDEGLEVLGGDTFEIFSQAAFNGGAGEAGGGGTFFESVLAEVKFGVEPIGREIGDEIDDRFGGAILKVFEAVAFEIAAGFEDEFRRETGGLGQIDKKIIGQFHGEWRESSSPRGGCQSQRLGGGFALAESLETGKTHEREEHQGSEESVGAVVTFGSVGSGSKAADPDAGEPVGHVADEAADGDEKSEDAAAHFVRDSVHESGFHHGETGHEEKSVGGEGQAGPMGGEMRENEDEQGGDDEDEHERGALVAIAQVAEERVADG